VIATKLYFPSRSAPNVGGLSRKAIFTEIDNSLRRLGTDHVDLYQIHRWDYATPIEETLEALHDVVKAGKARYIGASSMFAWQFAKALFTAERHGWTRFVAMQASGRRGGGAVTQLEPQRDRGARVTVPAARDCWFRVRRLGSRSRRLPSGQLADAGASRRGQAWALPQ
jgi:hypothetical protein